MVFWKKKDGTLAGHYKANVLMLGETEDLLLRAMIKQKLAIPSIIYDDRVEQPPEREARRRQDATPSEQFLGVTARFWRELVENLFSVTCAVCDRLWFAGDVSMIGGVRNGRGRVAAVYQVRFGGVAIYAWNDFLGAVEQYEMAVANKAPPPLATPKSDIEAFMIDVFGWVMLGDNTSVVVTGYFNVDIARQEGKRFTSFVLECFGLACVNKPTVRTARHRTCIDLVFTKNVPAVSVHLMAVYHSDHKAMVTVDLGDGLFMMAAQFNHCVKKSATDSKMVRNTALSLWTHEELLVRSVTGNYSRRFLKECPEGTKQPMTPKKLKIVRAALRAYIGNRPKEEVDARLAKTNTYLATYVQDTCTRWKRAQLKKGQEAAAEAEEMELLSILSPLQHPTSPSGTAE
ncbi:hypothetical protein HPB47_005734 [Ixodes persulcatus]|uniref:Uncharacterized protein n=1 Tax=Ixodes persulcatus TaxID=34615 RepID=A0AC60PC51_IXOPE|nr:hypothetical protein HPB47_005734 [Ixodes persulcatus]